MKNLSDLETMTHNSNASTRQSQTDGKECSHKNNQSSLDTKQHQKDLCKMCVTIGAINKLFFKMLARYGNQWSSQWVDPDTYKLAMNEWYEELKHLTMGDIKCGLDNYNGDFPPNLMQFKNACTTEQIGKPAPCYNEYKSLPGPKKSLNEHGNAQLRHIRSFL